MAARRETSRRSKGFSPTTPHFLLRIPKDNGKRDTKLSIPEEFVKKYGGDLSSSVYLKLPSGSQWQVRLQKWDGEAWFGGKGWQTFSEFYSLEYPHSLFFGYEGNSEFRVCIFDASQTEIDYPLKMHKLKEIDCEDESENDWSDDSSANPGDDCSDDSLQILDELPPRSRKTREKPPFPCLRPHQRNRTDKCDFPGEGLGGGESSTSRFPNRTKAALGWMNSSTLSGSATALQRAQAFESNKPFFIVPMKPSYINCVWLPSKFTFHMKHLGISSGEVIIRVLDGRTWSLELIFERTRTRTRLQSGWPEFVQGNNLNSGDACVLVLIDDIRPAFEVVIFRTTESTDCTLSPGKNSKDVLGSSETGKLLKSRPQVSKRMHSAVAGSTSIDIGLQRANAFKSEYLSFKVALNASYFRGNYMSWPTKFVKQFLKPTHDSVILHASDGRSWCIKLVQSWGGFRLQTGLRIFLKDNHLRIGDVCVFKLVSVSRPSFNVVIFRPTEAANCTLPPDVDGEETEEEDEEDGDEDDEEDGDDEENKEDEEEEHEEEDEEEDEKSVEILEDLVPHKKKSAKSSVASSSRASLELKAADEFVSEFPFFKATLGESCKMYVPAGFKKFLQLQKKIVTARLWVGDRSWPVKMIDHTSSYQLCAGWAAFRDENRLKFGDVCILELIDKRNLSDLSMNVNIFRCGV